MLRHASDGPASGFLPLTLLPIVWLGVFGTRRELIAGLVVLALTLFVPYLVAGEPQYPPSSLRSSLLTLMVAALAGAVTQTLLEEARRARDRFRRVVGTATETAIIAAEVDTRRITLFNTGAERMLGYGAAEMVGAPATMLHDPAEITERALELGIEPGPDVFTLVPLRDGSETRQWTYIRKDGERIRVSLTITVHRDEDGRPTELLGVASDVTPLVRARAELQAERDVIARGVDTAAALVIVLEPDGTVQRFNQACERLTGRKAADVIGLPAEDVLLPPDVAGGARQAFSALRPPDFPFEFEIEWMTASGERRLIQWAATCLVDTGGAITHVIGTGTDITEQRRAAEQLRISTDRLRAILEYTAASIAVKDLEGRYLIVSRAWERVAGVTGVEGRTDADLFPADQAEARVYGDREVVRTGEVVEWEREAGDVTLAVTSFPLRDAAGELYAIGSVATDISERRRALAEAIAASRAKSEFLANMSHEIRTPLNGVIGMLEILSETELDAAQRSYVATATLSGDALLGVINDVLDFSKIEAGKLELDEQFIDVRQIIEDTCEMVAPQAHAQGRRAHDLDRGRRCPSSSSGDGGRIRQVLTNLLANAVKFTPHGEVSVRAGAEALDDGDALLRVEVRDTGIGIDPEALDPAVRAVHAGRHLDHAALRRAPGSGWRSRSGSSR